MAKKQAAAKPAIDPTANQKGDDSAEALAKDALATITKKIVDEVFLVIQNDNEMMVRYLHMIECDHLENTNRVIAAYVKEKLHLETTDVIQRKPKSTIIQSYHELA